VSGVLHYTVDVEFRGEGYANRTFVVAINNDYRGEGDNAAKRAAAEQTAREEYAKLIRARVVGFEVKS